MAKNIIWQLSLILKCKNVNDSKIFIGSFHEHLTNGQTICAHITFSYKLAKMYENGVVKREFTPVADFVTSLNACLFASI